MTLPRTCHIHGVKSQVATKCVAPPRQRKLAGGLTDTCMRGTDDHRQYPFSFPRAQMTSYKRPKFSMQDRRRMLERHGLRSEGRIQVFCAYCRKSAIARWIDKANYPESWGRPPKNMGLAWVSLGLDIDHIVPVAAGGRNHVDNLALACSSCNSKKGTDSVEKFLARCKVDPLRDYDEKVA